MAVAPRLLPNFPLRFATEIGIPPGCNCLLTRTFGEPAEPTPQKTKRRAIRSLVETDALQKESRRIATAIYWDALFLVIYDVHPSSVSIENQEIFVCFEKVALMGLTEKQKLQLGTYSQDQPVLKAFLFGSYVREDARQDSDIDLLVELNYTQRIGLQFVQMKLDLEQLLQKKVDLVSANGVSPLIRKQIDQEKQLLYARG
ncbi:MAG: nucleotidyltransferase domain-containing protein [Bacteroidota bacterium]